MKSLLVTVFSFIAGRRRQRFLCNKMLLNLCKTLAISGLIVFSIFIYIFNNPNFIRSNFFSCSQSSATTSQSLAKITSRDDTNVSHIVFGISSSSKSWPKRKHYMESWWKPNITQGYIFFDKFSPELSTLSPLFKLSEETTTFEVFSKHVEPSVIRIVRVILETFRASENDHKNSNARWYVMGDDDTIFFVDNLVKILGKYDHEKYFYIGGISECAKSNYDFSFNMAFGGGGFALSRPLAAALVTNLDYCIERYRYYRTSDLILQSCIADIGVSLTIEKGFHQIDLHNDISGFLSAHPQSPLVSLHHLDNVLPIFPSMSRHQSVNHLMKAANASQSRLLQQTICYDELKNWSYSISWGYSVHVFEQVFPRSALKKPLETFSPWNMRSRSPFYMFGTRKFQPGDPCEAPHVFFFESLNETKDNQIVTSYVRSSSRGIPACLSSGNHSADHVSKIQILSSVTAETEDRVECCDLVHGNQMNISKVKFRGCIKGETIV